MRRPEISVVMAACERELPHYGSRPRWPILAGALASLAAGGLEDFEVLVGCDGHSEHVRRVVESFGERFRYFAFPRRGVYGGGYQRNGLTACAAGKWLYALDDDDRLTPGGLAFIVEAAEGEADRPHMFRMEYRDGTRLWPDGQITGEIALGHVSTQMFAVPNIASKLGRWGLRNASDWSFISSTMQRGWPPPIWHDHVIARLRHQLDREPWGDEPADLWAWDSPPPEAA